MKIDLLKRIDVGFSVPVWLLHTVTERSSPGVVNARELEYGHGLRAGRSTGSNSEALPIEALEALGEVQRRRFLQISRRLVLGCIDSYDSNQILIFSGFSRSTKLFG